MLSHFIKEYTNAHMCMCIVWINFLSKIKVKLGYLRKELLSEQKLPRWDDYHALTLP